MSAAVAGSKIIETRSPRGELLHSRGEIYILRGVVFHCCLRSRHALLAPNGTCTCTQLYSPQPLYIVHAFVHLFPPKENITYIRIAISNSYNLTQLKICKRSQINEFLFNTSNAISVMGLNRL